MSRQFGVGRYRFQSFAALAIAEPPQDCVAPKAHFTVALGNALGTRSPKESASAESATSIKA
jgi:hypothetical protein